MKLSSYFIVTEPEKMGFPYLESIGSACSFSDEVVVVCGRKEQSSEDKIKNISDKVKIINTNAWPIDWNYSHMKEHLQIGLKSCTGDIALKIDADHVFRREKSSDIRKSILGMPEAHRINIGRINFYLHPVPSIKVIPSNTCYALNKNLLREDGIKYKICNNNGKGSNQPVFEEDIVEKGINVTDMWPVNYDNTFMTKEQIVEKWIRWWNAVASSRALPAKFNLEDREGAWKDYVAYQARKAASAQRISFNHPEIIRDRVAEAIRRKDNG